MLDWNTQASQSAPHLMPSVEATGILVGTSIATSFGWRPIEAICCGDMVLTFDHGFRSVVGVRRVLLWDGRGECPKALRPIRIDANLLDNTQDVDVLPEQGIMVESDAAVDYRGDPFAVLMPRSMEAYGFADIVEQSLPIEAVVLEFEDDEVVYGQSGLRFHIPKAGDLFVEVDPALQYKVLNTEETFELLEDLNAAHQQQ
jgi:hypothetical protein